MAFGSSFCTIFGVRLLLPAFRAPMAALDNAFNIIGLRRRWKKWYCTETSRANSRGEMCREQDESLRVRPDKMDDLRLCGLFPRASVPMTVAVCSPLRDERRQLSTVEHVFPRSPDHRQHCIWVKIWRQQPMQWENINKYCCLVSF